MCYRSRRMGTRTEQDMMNVILAFATEDPRVRAVVMNGSRVNPRAARDPFQDYDIVYYVTELEPFRIAQHVLPHFGEAMVVEQPLLGPWPPADADGSYHNYNVQLMDGNRVDMAFALVDKIGSEPTDSLTKVLLDKDHRFPPQPPPNESSYFPARPTADAYYGCCTAFYFAIGSHIPKAMWRKELPHVKSLIECWLRQPTRMMLAWEVGIRIGWDTSVGANGKHLRSYLLPELWREYEQTYADHDYGNLWNSLFRFLSVFEHAARRVAGYGGYSFPAETATRVRAFLEHVRALPPDAETIY